MRLHAPVPNIAIDVGGIRRREEEHGPHQDAEAEQIEEVPAALLSRQAMPASQKQPREGRIYRALGQGAIHGGVIPDLEK